MIVALLVALAALAACLLVAAGRAAALGRVAEVARRLTGGDLRHRTLLAPGDALGDVGAALDRLAAEIQARAGEADEDRNLRRSVLDAMADGVVVAGADGRVIFANPAARAMLADPGAALAEPIAIAASGAGEAEAEIDGARDLRIRLRASRLSPVAGGGVVAVLHDITDLRRLETMRRDFVANVSHELRTPVAAIQGYAETLVDAAERDPARAGEFARVVHRHALRLSRLVADLLDLSRIEAGEQLLRVEPLDVREALARAAEVARPRAEAKRQRLAIDVEEGLLRARADEGAVDQVLANLLDNAIAHTPEGGAITVAARGADGLIAISVSDTGVGIAPEHLPRLFERFYRVDAGRSREMGGTGLGLAIVRHLVEALGGKVRVESEPGRGSTFTFTLPRA